MEDKSKYKLIKELVLLRQRVIQLEKLETARKKAEESLRKSEEKYRLVVENANEAIVVIQNGRFRFFNKKILEITGYTKDEFASETFEDFIHPVDKNIVIQRHFKRMKGEEVSSVNSFRIIDKNNRVKWVEANAVLIEWEGEPAILNFMTDITDRKQSEEALRESEARYRTLFESANDAIFLETEFQEIIDVNDRACEMFGYTREEFMKMKISDLKPATEKTILHSQNQFGNGKSLSSDMPVEMAVIHRNGDHLTIEFSVTPLVSGRRTLFMTIARDNTERRKVEERIKYLALHDELTGLPNRTLFFDRLNQALSRAHRYKHVTAILYIDLDGFKPVNDMFGHKAGDTVLKEVANRLKLCIRETDTAARIGGDEFAVILQDLQKKEYVENIAERIVKNMSQGFCIEDKSCMIGVSIGISTYPSDGHEPDILIKKADTAMYRVKGKGKNSFCYYTPEEEKEKAVITKPPLVPRIRI